MPNVFELKSESEKQKIMTRIIKANVKLPKLIDPNEISRLSNCLIEKTLSLITVSFTNFKKLQHIVDSYDTQTCESEMQDLAKITFKQKSELACYVFAMEKKYSSLTVSNLLLTGILHRFVSLCK
jgi:hypothetical protein